MRNKIILFTLLSTLIFSSTTFIKAAGYDVEGQTRLIPILRWMAQNPDYLWAEQYLPFVAQANMWGIMTNFQVLQPIQNGQKIKINNLATDGCLVGKEGFDYYLRAYEIPRQLKGELKGGGYAIIKKLTIEDCQRGYVEFEMPPLIISPEKPPVSSAIFYFVITKEQLVSEIGNQEALAVSPPLKYTYVPPQPKITIIPQLRTQEIREIRPNTTTQIQYAFEVTNVPTNTPFYLNSLTFRLNQQYQWPFKEIQVEVTKSDTTERLATRTVPTSSRGAQLTVTFPLNTNLPLTNGTYTVVLKGLTYSPQDKDFPYTNGHVSFRLTSVTAKDINNKIEVKSTGEDVSHTYKIIVPYYPNVTINAKVGSDEYPALVYEKQGNIATLYFTSFTGRFNAIRAGIQLSTTSTLPTRGVTTTGITKTIEVNQNCGGTCPRTYEGLVAKFGSPDKWAIPLIRWDWSKTAQYTLNIYMNCSGWIPQINNSDPTKSKSFVFVCSNRKAFGNNFGWNRQLTVRLNWALTGNEKLDYEVFYPEVVKLSLKNILQKSLPASMFKVRR